MQNIRIDGISTINSGEYDHIEIDGLADCKGDLYAQVINVDGTFSCKGKIEAQRIKCDGLMNCSGNLYAEKMEIDGILSLKEGSIEAQEIRCDGSLKSEGQISADLVHVDGLIHAREIVGDRIIIRSNVFGLVKIFFRHVSSADLIEATTIELSGTRAQTVNGHDIVIGPLCQIQFLDYTGTLTIDPSATVVNVRHSESKESL